VGQCASAERGQLITIVPLLMLQETFNTISFYISESFMKTCLLDLQMGALVSLIVLQVVG